MNSPTHIVFLFELGAEIYKHDERQF